MPVIYEKRKQQRRVIQRTVKAVTISDSRAPMECTLRDVSESGARVHAPDAASLPSEFLLVLSDDVQRWCRVVRRTKNDLGVQFIRSRRTETGA